jgi:polyphosphate kinase 2
MEGQKRWKIYTKYKENMFLKTDSNLSPWKIIDSNDKFAARINSIKYVLSKFKNLSEMKNFPKQTKPLKLEKLKDVSAKDIKILNKNKSLINLLSRNDTSLSKTLRYYKYEKNLLKLQLEMIKLQNWVYEKNKKVIIVCEGRDAAGKGGAIRRAIENLNPRKLKVVALPKPSNEEMGQWYFQRYVEQFPNNGEIVFFDRSWYNRAVVEPVNGFCSKKDYNIFMTHVNEFENIIINNGIILLKFYFSVSKETQAKRFDEIKNSQLKKWKFTEVDGKAQKFWEKYSAYKDKMFKKTNTSVAPWNIISADKKMSARINAIKLILNNIPYDSKTLIHSEKINF